MLQIISRVHSEEKYMKKKQNFVVVEVVPVYPLFILKDMTGNWVNPMDGGQIERQARSTCIPKIFAQGG